MEKSFFAFALNNHPKISKAFESGQQKAVVLHRPLVFCACGKFCHALRIIDHVPSTTLHSTTINPLYIFYRIASSISHISHTMAYMAKCEAGKCQTGRKINKKACSSCSMSSKRRASRNFESISFIPLIHYGAHIKTTIDFHRADFFPKLIQFREILARPHNSVVVVLFQ